MKLGDPAKSIFDQSDQSQYKHPFKTSADTDRSLEGSQVSTASRKRSRISKTNLYIPRYVALTLWALWVGWPTNWSASCRSGFCIGLGKIPDHSLLCLCHGDEWPNSRYRTRVSSLSDGMPRWLITIVRQLRTCEAYEFILVRRANQSLNQFLLASQSEDLQHASSR